MSAEFNGSVQQTIIHKAVVFITFVLLKHHIIVFYVKLFDVLCVLDFISIRSKNNFMIYNHFAQSYLWNAISSRDI